MNEKRWPERVIGLMLLVSMGCAGLALYAGDRKAAHWGPRMLERTPAGEVWVVLDQELLIASPEGALRRRVALSGLPGPVNALVPLPGGENQPRMLVGVIKLPEWLVMDGDGQVVERIRPSGSDVPFDETFHLAAAPDGRIAMSTGGDHQVLLFSAAGRYLARSEPGLFRFANGLWFEDGRWWVVDTNHHQIRILDGDTLKPESKLAVAAVDGAHWPSLARRGEGDRGSITVAEMRNGMQYGVVFDMSASGRLMHQFRSQAENPQPMDFLWLDGRLLMADSGDFSLQLFDQEGRFLGPWGDGAIAAALRTARADRSWWSGTLLASQAGAVILGVLALAGYFSWKRRAETLPVLAHSEDFPHLATPWLREGDELVDRIKLFWPLILPLSVIAIVPPILMPFAGHFARALQASLHAAWFMPTLGLAAVAAIAAVIRIAFAADRFMRRRVHEPRFEALLSTRWVKWSKRSRVLRDALEAGESPQEILMVYTTRLFPLFNMNVWVLTNHRVLIFALGSTGRGKLLASLHRRRASLAIEAAKGWFWWAEAFGRISLRLPDGRVFSGYPSSPVTARRMADLLALARGGPHSVAPSGPTPTRRAGISVDSHSPSPAAAVLLSLLLPGVAQMTQNRFVLGLVLFVVMLVNVAFFLTPVLVGWIGHFYAVSLAGGVGPVLFALVWALLAAWDAGNYARGASGTPISPRA